MPQYITARKKTRPTYYTLRPRICHIAISP